jgi:hypothetical protein
MKTDQIVVTSKGCGMDEALSLTEKLGQDAGLENKPVLHLRLLTEELFGMLRSLAGEVEAVYWIEAEGKSFDIHLKSEIKMTEEIREQLLSASSSGKNAAASGFTGKLRVFIADMLISAKEAIPYAMINSVAAFPEGGAAGEMASIWTMSAYKNEVNKNLDTSDEANAAWDELEKSILASIADDIKVAITGKKVEITVYKAF